MTAGERSSLPIFAARRRITGVLTRMNRSFIAELRKIDDALAQERQCPRCMFPVEKRRLRGGSEQ